MKLQFLTSSPSTRPDLVMALAVDGVAPKLGDSLSSAIKGARATGDVGTEFRAVSVFHPAGTGKGTPKRLGFVGIGKKSGIDTEKLRRVAALAQQEAESLRVKSFRFVLDAKDLTKVGLEAAGCAIGEGLVLGAYRYAKPQKEKPESRTAQKAEIELIGDAAQTKAFRAGLQLGEIGANATVFARDIENRGANHKTPTILAKEAKKLAGDGLRVKILEESDMKRLKMGSLLGVSRGSEEPAKLIIFEYGSAKAKKTICVVGKGLTFDTGGISIKPSAKMDQMRYDMCGGGAVLGLLHAIKNGGMKGLRNNVRIVGIVAASENMPDGKAQKPGDIVTAMDGTTIEILNTDAEGRLILADALAYAVKNYKPDMMVDLATLTGAVVVALGHEVAGVMGNNDKLIESLREAGDAADEPLWQLPMWPLHKNQVKSKFADVANLNSPAHGNGSTAGGAFLWHFVGDTPWAHLDIAGTAWGGMSKDYYKHGASGTAVRTLLHWLRNEK